MIFNNKIRIQRKIIERTELLSLLDRIRKNIRSYNKERNKKKDTINHRNKIDTK